MATKSTSAKKSGAKKQPAKKLPAKKASAKSDAALYTDPALRERLKKKIQAGDKGGKPGQWSARKAQLLAQEYEKAGGGYKKDARRRGPSQKSLAKWTNEEWQTSDAKPAERANGTTRYLPQKAWSKLSASEKRATNKKKQTGSRKGEQFVANTAAAKKARRAATKK